MTFPLDVTSKKTYHCVGCGKPAINPAYKQQCQCLAHLIVEDAQTPSAAYIMRIMMQNVQQSQLFHLDYWVGISDHRSNEKDEVILLLKYKGAKWSWECMNCGQEIVKRAMHRKMLKQGIHPDLRKLVAV